MGRNGARFDSLFRFLLASSAHTLLGLSLGSILEPFVTFAIYYKVNGCALRPCFGRLRFTNSGLNKLQWMLAGVSSRCRDTSLSTYRGQEPRPSTSSLVNAHIASYT